ncbi:MAG TPA: LuxR C-terminal-related transcriptional regulator [Kofleriaceae bacterium]
MFDAMLAAEYDPEKRPDGWLQNILRATEQFFDRGQGAIGWLLRRDQQLMPMAPTAINGGERFIETATRIGAGLGARSLSASVAPSRPSLETASEALDLGPDLLHEPAFREHAHPLGIKDFLAFKATSPCGKLSCTIGTPLARIERTSSYDKTPWRLLAKHMSFGLGVLHRSDNQPLELSDAANVFAPDGRVLHLATTAGSDCLASLRRAVLARERARLTRTDPGEAVELLDGALHRYALIDHFETDGKRFVIACAPCDAASPVDKLSPRLRQIANLLVTTGKSRKELAEQLGISIHTLDTEVKALYRRLNVRSRSELVTCARLQDRR